MMHNVSVIIAAAGNSSRMDGVNKQFAEICGIPVLIRSALAFEETEEVSEIVISAKEEDHRRISALCTKYDIKKFKGCAKGGDTRQQSVINALKMLSRETDLVAVHDGATPLVSPGRIKRCI